MRDQSCGSAMEVAKVCSRITQDYRRVILSFAEGSPLHVHVHVLLSRLQAPHLAAYEKVMPEIEDMVNILEASSLEQGPTSLSPLASIIQIPPHAR